MLVDQRPWEDCIDRKIGRATILTDAVLADDDQTLESSGILHADCSATVVYLRAKLEVARAKDICPCVLTALLFLFFTVFSLWHYS